ncbi:MAG TPA: chemotaxis protein CheW [Gemmatimonadaceae bacterium]|jgi:purine-binding chemotaxis protein CheW|nr:chemotaxis protein CheW [Gemmatimonadaceae bacterium]
MFRDGVARVLVFRVGSERFAVSLPAVAEVIESPELQRMPDAPEHVRGVATLRGELLSVYDPLALLGVSGAGNRAPSDVAPDSSAESTAGATLVFNPGGGHCVGLAVDDVYDAITIGESELRGVPGSDGSDGALMGLVLRGSELIGVLDVRALLDGVLATTPGEETT